MPIICLTFFKVFSLNTYTDILWNVRMAARSTESMFQDIVNMMDKQTNSFGSDVCISSRVVGGSGQKSLVFY